MLLASGHSARPSYTQVPWLHCFTVLPRSDRMATVKQTHVWSEPVRSLCSAGVKMNHRSGDLQSKNRGLVPQKLRHFFDSFPDSYEIPTLPDWILRRPMGSVFCVPKKSHLDPPGPDQRQRGRRNRIEPESNAQFLPKRRVSTSKRANKVSNLTYRNTWSSFFKTSQSDKVKFFPIKSFAPGPSRPSVRFNHRRSCDDLMVDAVTDRQRSAERICRSSNKPRSASPLRRRPSSMRAERKYSKLESKALREAWLNENVFPQFAIEYSARKATERLCPQNNKTQNSYTLHEMVSSCPPVPPYRPSGRNRRSIDANVSSSNDTFLSPGSMEMSATSTLPTTSGSIQVNATSSNSFDSMLPADPSSPDRDQHYQQRRCFVRDDSLLETTTNNSQSVEVQVSSTITSSTSMHPHMSSSSGAGYPNLIVHDLTAATVAREVLKKERAISSANSRKSCLKERSSSSSRGRSQQASNFKDPSRLEWTKRYLYT